MADGEANPPSWELRLCVCGSSLALLDPPGFTKEAAVVSTPLAIPNPPVVE
jgi:hypothetical protein